MFLLLAPRSLPCDFRELAAGHTNRQMVKVIAFHLNAKVKRVEFFTAFAVTSNHGCCELKCEAATFRTSCYLSREALLTVSSLLI